MDNEINPPLPTLTTQRRDFRRRPNLEQILKRRLQLDFVVGTTDDASLKQEAEKPKFAFYDYLGKFSDVTTTSFLRTGLYDETTTNVSGTGSYEGITTNVPVTGSSGETTLNERVVDASVQSDENLPEKVIPRLIDQLSPAMRSVLACPACQQCMQPPISLCTAGHRVCSNCLPLLSMCPKCRGQYAGSRDEALEALYWSVTSECEECGVRIATRGLEAHRSVCSTTWVDL